jgi:hypothetical protein
VHTGDTHRCDADKLIVIPVRMHVKTPVRLVDKAKLVYPHDVMYTAGTRGL